MKSSIVPKLLSRALVAVGALGLAFVTAQAAEKHFKLKVKPYPLDVCAVSAEKLDSMGDPVFFTVGDQEVGLCCASCKKDFTKDKDANLAKIQEAAKKVKPYPLMTCIVSGEALEKDEAVGAVAEGREFMFCCKSCMKDFKKDTAKFAKKLDETIAKLK
ncbi:MAG: hypothetical protein AB7O66_04775 [Limisphaerales bacterium]